jgi:ATP-dependent DNA helicase RecQ
MLKMGLDRLGIGHVNDPEQDARLALQVLTNQIAACVRTEKNAPRDMPKSW